MPETGSRHEFTVYAPLSRFRWHGTSYIFAPNVEIVERPGPPYPLKDMERKLTSADRDALFQARHWLKVEWSSGITPTAGELANMFLVSLWLAQPTRAHIKFRFRVGQDLAMSWGLSRLYDQFQWVESATADEVQDEDLESASLYFPTLKAIRENEGRLSGALHLTLAGCMAMKWQVALICYAAAAEALLTYSKGPGITNRLATAYACLKESTHSDRDRAFLHFKDLYDKRSDVIHGRGHSIPEGERLHTLAGFGDVLRSIWRAVILSPEATKRLEASDLERKKYFQTLTSGYSAPT